MDKRELLPTEIALRAQLGIPPLPSDFPF